MHARFSTFAETSSGEEEAMAGKNDQQPVIEGPFAYLLLEGQ